MAYKFVICTIATGSTKLPSEIADLRVYINDKDEKRWNLFPQENKKYLPPALSGTWDVVENDLYLANEAHLGIMEMRAVRPDFIDYITSRKTIISGLGYFSRTAISFAYVLSPYGF